MSENESTDNPDHRDQREMSDFSSSSVENEDVAADDDGCDSRFRKLKEQIESNEIEELLQNLMRCEDGEKEEKKREKESGQKGEGDRLWKKNEGLWLKMMIFREEFEEFTLFFKRSQQIINRLREENEGRHQESERCEDGEKEEKKRKKESGQTGEGDSTTRSQSLSAHPTIQESVLPASTPEQQQGPDSPGLNNPPEQQQRPDGPGPSVSDSSGSTLVVRPRQRSWSAPTRPVFQDGDSNASSPEQQQRPDCPGPSVSDSSESTVIRPIFWEENKDHVFKRTSDSKESSVSFMSDDSKDELVYF